MLGGTNSKNKQVKQPLGYTIIEVLIVLAVSGLMFVVAANFINGKQGRASFTEGTNDMASQIQNVVEQVADGQYSDIPLTCTFDGFSTSVSEDTTVHSNGTDSTHTGINDECVFLGKMLQFGGGNTYNVLSLAGGRVTTDVRGNAIQPDLTNTHPAVIDALTSTQRIPQQLSITSVKVPAGGANVGNFGFAEGLGNVSAGTFQTGAQTLSMIYSTGTPLANHLVPAQSAEICMTDGQRYAKILVGANNASQLSIRRQVVTSC